MTTKTLNDVIQGAYLLPVLLEHWIKPSEETKALLKNVDTDDLYKYKDLLTYHNNFLRSRQEDYPTLRKGLDEYFEHNLSDIFKKLGIEKQWLYMLDYGCGNGAYARQFIHDNPDSQVLGVDKSVATTVGKHISYMTVDFEKDHEWWNRYISQFDIVLLSEVLHCKTRNWQEYLVNTSRSMLKKGGRLIINENLDYEMQWRISQLKGYSAPVVDEKRIIELTKDRFQRKKHETINQHNIYVYERI